MTPLTLRDAVVVVTGASRGIGQAIAERAAREGATVALLAKSAQPGRLPGTIHEVAAQVEQLGGKALPIAVDVRDETALTGAIEQVTTEHGRIDVLVNNAGAIWLRPLGAVPPKRLDLMLDINVRAAYLAIQAALPALRAAPRAHVVSLSPPIRLEPRWFAQHTAYTTSKFALSLVTIGAAAELAGDGIAVNALWPRTTIDTAAIRMLGGELLAKRSRRPEIVADAWYALVTDRPERVTGQTLLDEEVLRAAGVTDFTPYAVDQDQELADDLFVD